MPDVRCNKAELAHALSVSLPTLSRWMLRYGADFPVIERGSNGRNYVFDFDAVCRFLGARREEERQVRADRDEELAQLMLAFDVPGMEVPATKALSVKDEIASWDLRAKKRKEAEASGVLVPAAPLEALITATLGRLSRDAQAFLRQLGREQGWPDSYMRSIEARFGDMQRVAVAELDRQFTSEQRANEPARLFA